VNLPIKKFLGSRETGKVPLGLILLFRFRINQDHAVPFEDLLYKANTAQETIGPDLDFPQGSRAFKSKERREKSSLAGVP